MKEYIKYLILIIVFLLIEVRWPHFLRIYNTVPDFLLCSAVCLLNRKSEKFTFFFCLFSGIAMYSITGIPAYFLSYLLIIPIYRLSGNFMQSNLLFYSIALAILSFITELFIYIFGQFCHTGFALSMAHILIQILINLCVGGIIYYLSEIIHLRRDSGEFFQ
ncbi:MAG: hypothetical protein KBT47_05580 [Armatimonadetes bacterium]|nr:hypothetical protein [Candidatus Hippobium faecium]